MLIYVILSDTLRNFFGYSAASSSDSSIFIYFVFNIDPLQSREVLEKEKKILLTIS